MIPFNKTTQWWVEGSRDDTRNNNSFSVSEHVHVPVLWKLKKGVLWAWRAGQRCTVAIHRAYYFQYWRWKATWSPYNFCFLNCRHKCHSFFPFAVYKIINVCASGVVFHFHSPFISVIYHFQCLSCPPLYFAAFWYDLSVIHEFCCSEMRLFSKAQRSFYPLHLFEWFYNGGKH